MASKYDYLMTSDGRTLKMRNGVIYDLHKDYPLSYKNLINRASSVFTSLMSPDNFFKMEVKEWIDKIENGEMKKEDYVELLKDGKLLQKDKQLQIALIQDKNTPTDIIKEIAKTQSKSIKKYLLYREDLDDLTLKKIFDGISFDELSVVFGQYMNNQREIPFSQKSIEFCVKHFAPQVQFKCLAHCRNIKLLMEHLNKNTPHKSQISTMIASNTHQSDKIREDVFFNIENDCDIFSVQNPTALMCKERYESLVSTFDIENETGDVDIEDGIKKARHHLCSAIENGNLSPSMQKDLFYRLSMKDWKDDKYYNLINAMTRYFDDSSTLNNICTTFVPHCFDDRLEPLYENKNTSTEVLNSLINYHTDTAMLLKGSTKYRSEINKINKIIPRIKPTSLLCDNLLRLEDKDVNLMLIAHSQIGININKFSETKEPFEKFFYNITKDKNLSNVAKKSLFETFKNPKENISFYTSMYGEDITKSTFGVDVITTGLLQEDVKNIKDFLDIQKSFTESHKLREMIVNYLEKIDIVFEKYTALHSIGLYEKGDDIGFTNYEFPKVLTMSKDEIADNLSKLSKSVIENIDIAMCERFLSLKTLNDTLIFYNNVDKYKNIFDSIDEITKERDNISINER